MSDSESYEDGLMVTHRLYQASDLYYKAAHKVIQRIQFWMDALPRV
jgi:hypothetical protein